MSKHKPVESIEIQTAKYLRQLFVAFTDGDYFIVFSNLFLGTAL